MKPVLWFASCSLAFWIWSSSARATGKYDIGFNEEWVSGYFQQEGLSCSDCPTNSLEAPYASIAKIIDNLASKEHVGAFREIIPDQLIEQDKANNYKNIIQILSLYSAYNVNLVISVGLPLAPSLSVTGSNFAIMPDSATTWNTLKNNLSYSFGNLVNAMWNSPSISRAWMGSRLYLEGFNEFDSLMDPKGSTAYSSPLRAVQLSAGINYVLNLYGIKTYQTMPSAIGNYSGYAPGVDPRVQFVSDYFAQGGIGFPNVHIYAPTISPTTTYQAVVNAVSAEVASVTAVLPTNLKGALFLTETGNADIAPPYCLADNGTYGPSIAPAQRASEYAAIAEDPTINKDVALLTFWRLMTLPPTQVPNDGCESFYGVLPYNTLVYNAVGQNLFNYLNQ